MNRYSTDVDIFKKLRFPLRLKVWKGRFYGLFFEKVGFENGSQLKTLGRGVSNLSLTLPVLAYRSYNLCCVFSKCTGILGQ